MITLNFLNNLQLDIKGFVTSVLPKFFGAVLILVVGWIAVKIVIKVIGNALSKSKRHLDTSLVNFILRTISITLRVLIVLSALSNLGISTTGIIAAF